MENLFIYLYVLMFPQFYILNIVFISIYKYIKYKKPNLKIHKFRIFIYILILIISTLSTFPILNLSEYMEEKKYEMPFEKQKHYNYFIDKGIDLDNLNNDLNEALNYYEKNYGFNSFKYDSVSEVCDTYNIHFNDIMFIYDVHNNKYVILSRLEDKDNSDIYLLARYEIPMCNNYY